MIEYPVVEIVRLEENESYGTFGVLRIQKQVFCVTLEPADRFNMPEVSCIPAQQYVCRRHVSNRFGETFMVTNVPGRTGILFHPGNEVEDTAGCILLAEHYGKLHGDRAILNSGKTFKRFMEVMKGFDKFHLTILECY